MSESSPLPDAPRRVRKRVMALHRAGERPDAEYAELRAVLDGVPKSERSLRWRQADVLLDVHFRKRARSAVRRLSRLRRTYSNRSESDRYDRLWTKVQDLLGDLTVSTHGYAPRLATRASDDVWSQVNTFLDRLRADGYPAFVSSGTLLGLVRGDGIIAHDDDVDLTVLLHATNSDEAASEWRKLRHDLRRADLLDVEFDDRGLVHTKAASPNGLKIDLFPGWLSEGRVYVFPYSFGDLAAEEVLPLGSIAFDDSTELSAPAQPESVLAANYGDDWRTPDPLFAFDWTTAKERFSRFCDLVRDGYAAE